MFDFMLYNDIRYLAYFATAVGGIYVMLLLIWYWYRYGLDTQKKYLFGLTGILIVRSGFSAWLRLYTIKNLPIAEQLASPGWIFAQWLAAIVMMVVAVHMTLTFARETNFTNKKDRRRKNYDRRKPCALT